MTDLESCIDSPRNLVVTNEVDDDACVENQRLAHDSSAMAEASSSSLSSPGH